MNKLNFRLTTPKYGSIAASTDDPDLSAELFQATERMVMGAMEKMNWHPVQKEGRVPEVISDTTLAKIDALESALEFCRNLMIDAIDNSSESLDDWKRAIDQAADALGYPEDER
ncbi:MAG: hypothetical protein KBG00_10560 [Rhodoferax sp.]|jgi:hypothetical protein|uniref:hypothetical protein n=1 Tax=Rhodoferax sp. TaxID=50421 RepID=UPI001B50A3C6|nr:hypothetical protein [Rhodoferax sp.]MBP9149210.1 hypothetical protein [Rhodoferax sp.]MBP9736161.1 hypothetical protein [Rhodoferax sp.]